MSSASPSHTVRFENEWKELIRDPWNSLDFLIALLGAIDTWVLGAMGLTDLRGVSLMCLPRLARILRVRKLAHFNQQLRVLMNGIIASIQAISFCSIVDLKVYDGSKWKDAFEPRVSGLL